MKCAKFQLKHDRQNICDYVITFGGASHIIQKHRLDYDMFKIYITIHRQRKELILQGITFIYTNIYYLDISLPSRDGF